MLKSALATFGLVVFLAASANVAGGLLATRARAQTSAPNPLELRCAQVRNDDAVRGYVPTLKNKLAAAFTRLFPDGQAPDEDELRSDAQIRCMGGRLYACFLGANLPCAKLDSTRDNPGAAEYCKDNPQSQIVPMAATGHDTIYSYRCRRGRAIVSGSTYKLDARGFASDLWTPLN
jgi:hypothetical protein